MRKEKINTEAGVAALLEPAWKKGSGGRASLAGLVKGLRQLFSKRLALHSSLLIPVLEV